MSPSSFAIVDRPRFDVAWPAVRLAAGGEPGKAQTRENCGADNATNANRPEKRRAQAPERQPCLMVQAAQPPTRGSFSPPRNRESVSAVGGWRIATWLPLPHSRGPPTRQSRWRDYPLGQNRASGLRWVSGVCGIEAGRSFPRADRGSQYPQHC